MCKRLCLAGIVAVTVAACMMSVVSYAQTMPPPPAPNEIVSGWHAQFLKGVAPPRTPWGDPDLQGNFTATDEFATPLERPAEFEGKTLHDITPADMEALRLREMDRGADQTAGVPNSFYHREFGRATRPWHVIDPPDGQLPPLTATAAAVVKEKPESPTGGRRADQASSRAAQGENPATYLDWSLSDRCITRNSPPESMLPGRLGSQVQIVQTEAYVTMRFEELRTTRIIPIKGRGADRPRLPYALRPYNGDATAWFEGSTLVVDTVYHDKDRDVMDAPAGTTRTIERFTRRTNPEGIEYTATMINPEWWVRPWSFQQILYEDNREGIVFEYECHETNYSMVNSLAASRALEKLAAAEAKRAAENAGKAR